ncbi:conserved hypothetical protein [Burkholderia mallei NCTC 10247]|uniref:DUF1993 domain-containing protein n=1 Tax=Burkholderia mallei (strain NCTC 10229) TaxID=412022 RepID=A2S2X3_BURM9|nr:conserved hypothetical protein [Burkholderia mallei NCTC 10229]ABO05637.1 conserved hypothetical protein [Burkholderia mallei NCTC 10247]
MRRAERGRPRPPVAALTRRSPSPARTASPRVPSHLVAVQRRSPAHAVRRRSLVSFTHDTFRRSLMSPTALLVPTFTHMLQSLSAWLDKAAAHQRALGAEPDDVLTKRLAADMFALAAQIRFTAFQAQEPVYRLRGDALPESLLEVRRAGWQADAAPGSLRDAQACLADARALLAGLAPHALDEGAERPIALELPNGAVFDMTGEQYLRDWALPQFYFHAIAAYAILRHHGVALGKPDYVSHMFAYLRPGTMPQDR